MGSDFCPLRKSANCLELHSLILRYNIAGLPFPGEAHAIISLLIYFLPIAQVLEQSLGKTCGSIIKENTGITSKEFQFI